MRKVYQQQKGIGSLVMAISFSVVVTAGLFAFLPFAHQIAKPQRSLELRKVTAADLPPPVEDTPPPPTVEEQKPPEAAPEPMLTEVAQQIPIVATIDAVMGTGGGTIDYGTVKSLTATQAIQDETFDVSELEKKPEAITQIPPAYPAELRKAKIEGMVTLVFVLSEEGRVEDARVENSSRPEFEKPALDAIRKWRFRPGEKDGQPVRTYIRIPMRFRVATG
jgi:periplasmic protein TonB